MSVVREREGEGVCIQAPVRSETGTGEREGRHRNIVATLLALNQRSPCPRRAFFHSLNSFLALGSEPLRNMLVLLFRWLVFTIVTCVYHI